MRRDQGSWMAFLAVCFAVVGLTGLFAEFAAPLPYQRAAARSVALDEALATDGTPDGRAKLEALRDRLDTSAATVIDGTGPLPGRVNAARAAMQAEMAHEASAISFRLRFMLVVVTVVAAGFGAVLLGAASRN